MVFWERRRKCVRRNEIVWLASRKEKKFLSPAPFETGHEIFVSTISFTNALAGGGGCER